MKLIGLIDKEKLKLLYTLFMAVRGLSQGDVTRAAKRKNFPLYLLFVRDEKKSFSFPVFESG